MSELKGILFKEYFDRILNIGKKQTSYKYYCLKALFYFINNGYKEVGFYDLACMMISVSYFDCDKYMNVATTHDRLMQMKSYLLSNEKYFGNNSINSIFTDVSSFKKKETVHIIKTIVAYAPYLLLSYGQWDDELKGLVTSGRNQKIEEFSQSEKEKLFYYIENKKIYFNEVFRKNISDNFYIYNDYIDSKIISYFDER